ncbi:hypothetical protein CLOACE_19780 [Clostridium acetireducens DSM 10703]|uniref:Uncharacterized protein n=1 Tax=Clostridium acetireducens DSM 10703 TaxID=1121290 RepID=A0A1E8EWJ6_9CLOT|nr:hypothetical protein [Clostridium acetireducens]OFI05009.1 hypothetical protein CLOACE_19780 [Clostridium acetireducens DSM 10703]
MQEQISNFYGLPQFMWEGIFNIIISLGAGLIIALITTFYLKRKDEVTRVEGLILEKRVNSMQEILNYLEKLCFHRELHNGRETEWHILLSSFELTLPNGPHLQYSDIFSNSQKFREFFKGFEGIIAKNKLWIDEKVKFHLALMQGYFSWINALLIAITRIPLPEDVELTEEDIDKLSNVILLQVGITLDAEINGLLAYLETLMVESIYKLDLRRPKKSMTRNGMLNIDMIKILKELDGNTLLGINREKYFSLLLLQVCRYKGVELDEEKFDDLIDKVFGYKDL